MFQLGNLALSIQGMTESGTNSWCKRGAGEREGTGQVPAGKWCKEEKYHINRKVFLEI
jgi:hypothetical protein